MIGLFLLAGVQSFAFDSALVYRMDQALTQDNWRDSLYRYYSFLFYYDQAPPADTQTYLYTLRKHLESAREEQNPSKEKDIQYILGSYYYFLDDYSRAINPYLEALRIAKEQKWKWNATRYTQCIGKAYLGLNDIPNALDYYLESANMKEEYLATVDPSDHQSRIKETAFQFKNLGDLAFTHWDEDTAMYFVRKGIKWSQKLDNPSVYNQLLIVYAKQFYLSSRPDWDSALFYIKIPYEYYKNQEQGYSNTKFYLICTNELGLIMSSSSQKNPKKKKELLNQALEYQLEGIKIKDKWKTPEKSRIGRQFFNAALSYQGLGNVQMASQFLDSAENYIRYSNYITLLAKIYKEQISILTQKSPSLRLKDLVQRYIHLNDSISRRENQQNREINRIVFQRKFEEENKAQQALVEKAKAEKKEAMAQAISIVSILSIICIILLFLYRSMRQRQQLAEAEKAKVEFESRRKAQSLIAQIEEIQSKALVEIVDARELEQRRIADEIHDGIGGSISAAQMAFSFVKNMIEKTSQPLEEGVEFISATLKQAVEEARTLSHQLAAKPVSNKSLSQAVCEMVIPFKQQDSYQIDLELDDLAHIQLDEDTKLNLYRILQESLRNVVKHSEGATNIRIAFQKREEILSLTIVDNGKGALPIHDMESLPGLGLQSIKQRVEKLKGQVQFTTGPNKGFKSYIEIPLHQEELDILNMHL